MTDKNHMWTEETLAQKKKMAYDLTHDVVTGLPNRILFSDRASIAIAHAQRNRERLAMMVIDLDHFTEIIHAYGDQTGDALLKQVSERLTHRLRKGDTMARIGGDAYALILPGLIRKENAGHLARVLMESFKESFIISETEFHLTPSIGIAILPEDGDTEEELLKKANIALSRAKENGRNNFQYFSPPL